jgi:hypothetical protein
VCSFTPRLKPPFKHAGIAALKRSATSDAETNFSSTAQDPEPSAWRLA